MIIDLILFIAVIIGLVGFLFYRENIYRQDINQLMNRLMARTFAEYVASNESTIVKDPTRMSDYEEYSVECKKKGIEPEKEEA